MTPHNYITATGRTRRWRRNWPVADPYNQGEQWGHAGLDIYNHRNGIRLLLCTNRASEAGNKYKTFRESSSMIFTYFKRPDNFVLFIFQKYPLFIWRILRRRLVGRYLQHWFAFFAISNQQHNKDIIQWLLSYPQRLFIKQPLKLKHG